ncbi:MAG: glycoside hydrolase family 55 protein [Candidatus Pacebacteria bacterium]|nr:glycoside hydrolase family 55 protein [Candidatus Paceibacterota bacterium]
MIRLTQIMAVSAAVCWCTACAVNAQEDDASGSTAQATAHMLLRGINVKTLGAVGDGKHDDTAAFQKAIEMTGQVEPGDDKYFDPKAILVPPGHYRITAPLLIKHSRRQTQGAHRGIKVMGASGGHHRWTQLGPHGNPDLYTELFWDGPEKGTMFDVWGTHSMHISNLLLNGRNKTAVLISINSPRGAGSANHILRNIELVNSHVGFECGNDSYICSSDMSFYDVRWIDCNTAFRTVSDQNLNYNFVRCGAANTGIMFDFQKGGSAVITLPSTYSVGTFLRVGSGGINAGTFTVNGCRLDGARYRAERTVVPDAKGETNVVFSGLLTSCTGLWPKTNEDGTKGPPPENTPMFVLGPHANVLVQGSMISGNVAKLTGSDDQLPTWIQFDNCRFRVRSDPRTMIETDEASGYELRNCVVTTDDGQNIMVSKRKAPAQEELTDE